MNTSKIKNIIILILLAANLFLLAAVISDQNQAKSVELAAWEAAVTAVENSGISVSDGIDGDFPTPLVYSVRRDLEAERSAVERLLGSASAEDLGGNIWFYSAKKGQASMRGTGESDVLFSPGAYDGAQDPAKTAVKLMKKLGLDANADNAQVSEGDETVVVRLDCEWKGCRVYNAALSFTFSDQGLMMASGTRVFDQTVQESGENVMDALTAMMRFVEVIGEEGYVCSQLRGLEVGYVMSVAVSGESTLTPVWHFTTDTGEIYINAVTGRTEAPE